MVGRLNSGLAGFGYVVIAIFVASWIVSLLIYRWSGLGRIVVERA
jgi:high-affinity nickel-transport protein